MQFHSLTLVGLFLAMICLMSAAVEAKTCTSQDVAQLQRRICTPFPFNLSFHWPKNCQRNVQQIFKEISCDCSKNGGDTTTGTTTSTTITEAP